MKCRQIVAVLEYGNYDTGSFSKKDEYLLTRIIPGAWNIPPPERGSEVSVMKEKFTVAKIAYSFPEEEYTMIVNKRFTDIKKMNDVRNKMLGEGWTYFLAMP